MAAGGLDLIVCIRIDDQMKEGKFEVAVNLNFWRCAYQNFSMSAVCTQSEFFFGEDVMLFAYQAKNNIVVVVVSLILVICGIVGLVIFGLLSYLIRKRYRNHQMAEMTELIDE